MISFYNPRGFDFSRDGIQFEAAFGDRLFGGSNQMASAEARLREDPATRRALGIIYDSSDSHNARLDVPCAIGVQLLRRDESIECVTLMRSQSAIMVLPYDVFLFTMLQEISAVRLGCLLGNYRHYSVSFHVYEDEIDALLEACSARPSEALAPMSPIQDASDDTLLKVFEAEKRIRKAYSSGTLDAFNVEDFNVDPYWAELLTALLIHALRKSGGRPQEDQWPALSETFRTLLW